MSIHKINSNVLHETQMCYTTLHHPDLHNHTSFLTTWRTQYLLHVDTGCRLHHEMQICSNMRVFPRILGGCIPVMTNKITSKLPELRFHLRYWHTDFHFHFNIDRYIVYHHILCFADDLLPTSRTHLYTRQTEIRNLNKIFTYTLSWYILEYTS